MLIYTSSRNTLYIFLFQLIDLYLQFLDICFGIRELKLTLLSRGFRVGVVLQGRELVDAFPALCSTVGKLRRVLIAICDSSHQLF